MHKAEAFLDLAPTGMMFSPDTEPNAMTLQSRPLVLSSASFLLRILQVLAFQWCLSLPLRCFHTQARRMGVSPHILNVRRSQDSKSRRRASCSTDLRMQLSCYLFFQLLPEREASLLKAFSFSSRVASLSPRLFRRVVTASPPAFQCVVSAHA